MKDIVNIKGDIPFMIIFKYFFSALGAIATALLLTYLSSINKNLEESTIALVRLNEKVEYLVKEQSKINTEKYSVVQAEGDKRFIENQVQSVYNQIGELKGLYSAHATSPGHPDVLARMLIVEKEIEILRKLK